jgi:hypothetical protein
MNADKSITCVASRLNACCWSALAHRSAFILAYRRQKTLASVKPQDVGRDENANAIALLLFRCGSSSDHGGHPVFRMVSRAEGPVRIGPSQIDAVSPLSWPYRTRTTSMLRPLSAHVGRSLALRRCLKTAVRSSCIKTPLLDSERQSPGPDQRRRAGSRPCGGVLDNTGNIQDTRASTRLELRPDCLSQCHQQPSTR